MALLGGQFKSATHGQFKSAQGGQFDRILQLSIGWVNMEMCTQLIKVEVFIIQSLKMKVELCH